MKMHGHTQDKWKKPVVLLFVGLVISLFLKPYSSGLAGGVFLSDMLFIIALVFIVTGLGEFVLNTGFFNSLVFGGKCLYRIFRRRLASSSGLKDEYIEFTNTRLKFEGISLLLLIGFGFLGVSVLSIL